MQKPSIPKGTRDFTPAEMTKRNYIFDVIRSVYQRYGYVPIETPAMENLSTLTGKYGDEGDKLIFKILNSGDFMDGVDGEDFLARNFKKITPLIAEKALRYDLTVPFARFVVQHQNEISFPFKRYQIQPVWRADRPQKGRYREFYQCDADVIGSSSLLNETELIFIIDDVFTKLGILVNIKINDRRILQGIAETIGEADKFVDITVALDKLDKMPVEKVVEELKQKGLSEQSIDKLKPVFDMNDDDPFPFLYNFLKESETGRRGIHAVEEIKRYVSSVGLKTAEVQLDITLARGLNYYTGAIFEVKAKDAEMGSICGGGRYDDLTGIFGKEGLSGVGISFGADRIYDVMEDLELFPQEITTTTKVLFVNFGPNESMHCLPLLARLRAEGISSEIYPDPVKMKKQMSYADSKNIPFVVIIGSAEVEADKISVKNMKTGEQHTVSLEDLMNKIKYQ
ncbi:MAG: histidine--tRNA ligase [Bacteroidia bacterium]